MQNLIPGSKEWLLYQIDKYEKLSKGSRDIGDSHAAKAFAQIAQSYREDYASIPEDKS